MKQDPDEEAQRQKESLFEQNQKRLRWEAFIKLKKAIKFEEAENLNRKRQSEKSHSGSSSSSKAESENSSVPSIHLFKATVQDVHDGGAKHRSPAALKAYRQEAADKHKTVALKVNRRVTLPTKVLQSKISQNELSPG